MTNRHLQQLVEEISLRYFAKPFRHHARFNSRLRSTGGRYYLKTHDIDVNPKMLTDFSMVTLVKVIKHELCHYHLHLAGYSGRHNTSEFKHLLKAVGGSRYAPRPKDVHWLKYRCQKCGRVYWRRRHINTRRYVCSYCYGPLKLES